MSANIMSPLTLWKDFDFQLPLQESVIRETRILEYKVKEIYFSGRDTGEGRPRIFANYSYLEGVKRPAVIILPDFEKAAEFELAAEFLKRGYNVLAVDYCGEREDSEGKFTVYPENVDYANYKRRGRAFSYAEPSAKETCWYEWTAAARYAVSYLLSKEETLSAAVFGIRGGGEIAWKLAGTDDRIKCCVIVSASGWEAYRGAFKYSENNSIEMDEERYRWIAGVDSQSYAQYVKVPLYFAGCTNDGEYSSDRARDTLARVNAEARCLFDFSPDFSRCIDMRSYKSACLFLDKYLKGKDLELCEAPEPAVTAEDGVFKLSVQKLQKTASYEVYYCEGGANPALRTWKKAAFCGEENGVLNFTADFGGHRGIFLAYTRVTLENGFTASSKLAAAETEGINAVGSARVIFNKNEREYVTACEGELYCGFIFKDENPLEFGTGPSGIEGVYSKHGLKVYVGSLGDGAARENLMLMLDLYAAEYTVFEVSIITEYGTERQCRYSCKVNVDASPVWQKLMFSKEKFKTDEGLPMKSAEKADVMVFGGSGRYLLNNVLFV